MELYFDQFDRQEQCVSLNLRQEFEVLSIIHPLVQIQDGPDTKFAGYLTKTGFYVCYSAGYMAKYPARYDITNIRTGHQTFGIPDIRPDIDLDILPDIDLAIKPDICGYHTG